MSTDRLFPRPADETLQQLERYARMLRTVRPLKSKHREQLKYDIRDMSRGLTSERSERKLDYMGDAKFLSPYLHYFVPWNLYRMSRLFTGLELDIPDGGHVADLGSGPLTAVMALWMARPHLRERDLVFTCMDRSPKALQTGLKLFNALAPKSPWRIKTVKANFTDHLKRKADLIMAANAFNELDWSGRTARPQAGKLAAHLAGATADTGRVLIVETGVRLTGRIIAEMRTQLMDCGFKPIAPCPHEEACPMPATAAGSPWCHFNFTAADAPDWLHELSAEARLEKDNASMNFLYLSRTGGTNWGAVRVISEAFPLHGNRGQYACSDKGLTLVEIPAKGRALFPGQLIAPDWPARPKVDHKSKAVLLPYRETSKRS